MEYISVGRCGWIFTSFFKPLKKYWLEMELTKRSTLPSVVLGPAINEGDVFWKNAVYGAKSEHGSLFVESIFKLDHHLRQQKIGTF